MKTLKFAPGREEGTKEASIVTYQLALFNTLFNIDCTGNGGVVWTWIL